MRSSRYPPARLPLAKRVSRAKLVAHVVEVGASSSDDVKDKSPASVVSGETLVVVEDFVRTYVHEYTKMNNQLIDMCLRETVAEYRDRADCSLPWMEGPEPRKVALGARTDRALVISA